MEDMAIYYSGRYGERIVVQKRASGQYSVSCEVLNIDGVVLSKEEFDAFIKRYVEDGVSDFDKTDIEVKRKRAIGMGKRLLRYFRRFQCYLSLPDKALFECLWYATDIYRSMMDVNLLGLTDEQFEKWFVRVGRNDTNEETEEYVTFALNVKKYIIDKCE